MNCLNISLHILKIFFIDVSININKGYNDRKYLFIYHNENGHDLNAKK